MSSQEDLYPFMPDQRRLRDTVRGMYAISALIAVLLAVFAVFLLIQRLTAGVDARALLVAAAAVFIGFFAWRSIRSLAATYCASADLILDEEGLLVAITDKRKLRVTREALSSARQSEVAPRSSFHPDRDEDRAILVTFADRRTIFRLTASYYRQRGNGTVIITPDHRRGRELANRLGGWSD